MPTSAGRQLEDVLSSSQYRVQIDTNNLNTSHALLVKLIGGSKTVLDLGCAEGDLARVLVDRGCTVSGVELDAAAAESARPDLERLLVADLSTVDLAKSFGDGRFDVVVLGDVLEHLAEPAAVLRQARDLLVDGGRVVISIPNVAHAAVRLSLLLGRWNYRPLGLLDATHVHFYTRVTLMALLADCGLRPLEWERTTAGPFETELGLLPGEIDPDVLATVLKDPDATTYQFVLSAVRDNDKSRLSLLLPQHQQLAAHAAQLEADLSTARAATVRAEAAAAERARDLARAQRLAAASEHQRAATESELQAAHAAVTAMRTSTSWRVAAPVRALGPLRSSIQGPPPARVSLRGRGGVRAIARSLRRHGPLGALRAARALDVSAGDYTDWVARHSTLNAADVAAIHRHIASWSSRPLLSVVVPTYLSVEQTLREALDSVRDQLYPYWELVIVDDASPDPTAARVAQEYAGRDPRIQSVVRPMNGGISAATNTACEHVRGEYVAFLDHDDVLSPHALYLVAAELIEHPDTALLYTDEDKLDSNGRRTNPVFKPDLNLDLLMAVNYVNHLTVVRTDLLKELGGARPAKDGAQDHDLILRVLAASGGDHVRHIPHVAYHWRANPSTQTYSSRLLGQATTNSRAAVQEHLAERGTPASVVAAPRNHMWNRVRWPLPDNLPGVTVVIPTRDRVDLLRQAVDGLLRHTDYEPLHILIADNESVEMATRRYLEQVATDPRVTVLACPGPFNYSAINNTAVRATSTAYVLLLNNDVAVRERTWLREMVSNILRPDVGVVGAKLLYADGTVQHGGVILGIGGVAGHSHKHRPASELGYSGRLILAQDCCAVTGACLLTSRVLWDEVGGLNETELGVALSDVDYCLRVRAQGQRVIWTPYAELDHLESASRGLEDTPEKLERFDRERAYMKRNWGPLLAADPTYNPNLTVHAEDFSRADPPRTIKPWLGW